MEPDITAKSTKSEILEAYNTLLTKVKEQKPLDRQAEKEKAEKKAIVDTAAHNSVERIVKSLAELKLTITHALDEMEQQLLSEFKKLNILRQAIEIEQKNLDEIHEIRVTADSLAALLLAQKEKRQAFEAEIEQKRSDFETEMTQKRFAWKKEQESYDYVRKEQEAEVNKAKQREEEEYAYTRQLQRKKDQDAYEARKAAMEKELEEKRLTLERAWSEREVALAAREKEWIELKAHVDSFPQELQKAVENTERSITERLQFNYQHEAAMLAKETEGERKLSQQIIASLQAKLKEQEEQIRQLTQKANEAGLQVQSIAVKAIEGASVWRSLGATHDRGNDPSAR